MKRRAIISVYDKTGVLEIARALVEMGWEIVSTGGTASLLRDAGVAVKEVSDVTGFPEVLRGRVKTLHPLIHAGILARRDDDFHMKDVKRLGITLVDMVCVNLYPFVEHANRPVLPVTQVMEQVDIGGPALLRAAAKNWQWVIPLCNPARYGEIIQKLREQGNVDLVTRQNLAAEVFHHTAAYDAAISAYLGREWGNWPLDFPSELTFSYRRSAVLRYGENPHQKGAYYASLIPEPDTLAGFRVIHGKEISFNNLLDADAAWGLVTEFSEPAACIIKHASPCGAAVAKTPGQAFEKAYEGDPVSAFGGIVAFNRRLEEEDALSMKKCFIEMVLAPGYTEQALEVLKKKKDLRIAFMPDPKEGKLPSYSVRQVLGGILVQERDRRLPKDENWNVVSEKKPTPEELKDLAFAMTVAKHVKSNAVVLAKGMMTVGIGGGQPNRVDAVRIAVNRAGERARGACMASDGFFPFPDSVEEAARAGVTAIAAPGGSIRDSESVEAANRLGVSLVFTGTRHFLH